MKRRRGLRKPAWQPASIKPLVRSGRYGRWIADAYRHRDGYLLIHEKWRHRLAKDTDRMGAWVVYDGDECIGRKSYYHPLRVPKNPPTEWARKMIRRHKEEEQ